MAKYSKKVQEKVEENMHEFKKGTLKSGKDGKGGKVKSREQAIAIGISEARKEGAKAPPKKKTTKKSAPKKAAKKSTAKKASSKKTTGSTTKKTGKASAKK